MGRAISSKSMQQTPIFNRRKQVAAVCYRFGKRGVQFLLVQTRSGRWIFPKGGIERGLTHAQSAALEAFEEAGVRGRIEEIPFTRYYRRRPVVASMKDKSHSDGEGCAEYPVTAYLCEVTGLEAPQEANRNPTWFSADKAKQRLAEDRAAKFGGELGDVVDRAVMRIQRLMGTAQGASVQRHRDGLQEVHLENLVWPVRDELSAKRYLVRRLVAARAVGVSGLEKTTDLRRVIPIGAGTQIERPLLRLGSGENLGNAPDETIAFDNGSGGTRTRRSLSSNKGKARKRSAEARSEGWLN
jgi:8-oxo-dGTP pyrophosphatase MutT (NUDIX family)